VSEHTTTRHPEAAEKLLRALDHLDAAYEEAKSVNAEVCGHIHLARVEAERDAGRIIFAAERSARLRHLSSRDRNQEDPNG